MKRQRVTGVVTRRTSRDTAFAVTVADIAVCACALAEVTTAVTTVLAWTCAAGVA